MDVIVLNYDLFAEETVASSGLHCIGFTLFFFCPVQIVFFNLTK